MIEITIRDDITIQLDDNGNVIYAETYHQKFDDIADCTDYIRQNIFKFEEEIREAVTDYEDSKVVEMAEANNDFIRDEGA
jgi:DNA mismatch repair ATPase MutS